MTDNKSLVQVFNNQFEQFINDVQNVFPTDPDIQKAKTYFNMIKYSNPKLFIKIWKNNIVTKYKQQIEEGNLTFFLEKDYKTDLNIAENSKEIMDCINRLRDPIKNMSVENQKKSMQYIKNLTELAKLLQ